MRAFISGTGSRVPDRVMTNAEVCARAPTTDEWIRTRLGIGERRIAAADEQASDLGASAARIAVQNAGLRPQDVDGILCALGVGDVLSPATAAYIQHKLGMNHRGFALDLRMACAGGLAGIHLARGMVESGLARHILVVGVHLGSRNAVDWTDRTTAPMFGDGAGAVVVSASQDSARAILAGRLHTDGSLTEIVGQYAGGTRQPMDSGPHTHLITMDGKAVWACAKRELPSVVRQVLSDANLTVSDVDFLVSHQANRVMLLSILEDLGIPQHKTFTNVERYGNTASASLLLALDEAVQRGHIKPGMRVVLMAIGAGMSWGAQVIRW